MSFEIARPFETRVPLASLTTLGVGGPVRYLARCADTDELLEILEWVRKGRLAAFESVRALKRVDLPTLGRPTMPSRSTEDGGRA